MKWFTKDGKMTANVAKILGYALSEPLNTTDKFYKVRYHDSGYYSKGWINGGHEYCGDIKRILEFFGISYTEKNDAPKGGRYGDYFEISLHDAINLQAIYMLFRQQ